MPHERMREFLGASQEDSWRHLCIGRTFHLLRYLDEQAFRYNNRKGMNDAQRFDLAVRQIVGKRLTDQLIGKKAEALAS